MQQLDVNFTSSRLNSPTLSSPGMLTKLKTGLLNFKNQKKEFGSPLAIRPDHELERDACGTGFIATKSGEKNSEILKHAQSALITMEDRGACCADGRTGDGAGIMLAIDHDVIGSKVGDGVGMVFLPQDPGERLAAQMMIARVVGKYAIDNPGIAISAWRDVPVDSNQLGELAQQTQPHVSQVIITRPEGMMDDEFESLLHKINRSSAVELRDKIAGASIVSMSSQVITYKALTNSKDLFGFYTDIKEGSNYQSHIAVIHRRQATNETTDWQRVHPNTMTSHNGEINAVKGNTECAMARESSLGLAQGEMITPSRVTDSFRLDQMMSALAHRTKLGFDSAVTRISSLAAAILPGARRESELADRLLEPWDGPAAVMFTDGKREIGAVLDRNGLRPLHYQETSDYVMAASEAGVYNFDDSKVLSKGRLGAGQGVRFELGSGKSLEKFRNNDLANELFKDMDPNTHNLDQLLPTANKDDLAANAVIEQVDLIAKQRLFGYTEEDLKAHLDTLIGTGKEAIGSMGFTARIAGLSNKVSSFFDYVVHEFAQVSNPPWDFLREKKVADTKVYLGTQPNIFKEGDLENPPPAIKLESPILSLTQMEQIKLATSGEQALIRSETFQMTFDRTLAAEGLKNRITEIVNQVEKAIDSGCTNIILSDREASIANPPIPSILVVGAIKKRLLAQGKVMNASIVVETAEAKNTHDLSALISYGASAVCPYMALSEARHRAVGPKYGPESQTAEGREKTLLKGYHEGVLKIMAKMGISVTRSYMGSGQHFPLGLGEELSELLGNARSPIKGIGFEQLASDILKRTAQEGTKLEKSGILREARPLTGFLPEWAEKYWTGLTEKVGRWAKKPDQKDMTEPEQHHMTTEISNMVRDIIQSVRLSDTSIHQAALKYRELISGLAPVAIRDFLSFKKSSNPTPLDQVQSNRSISEKFSVGHMSFGSISEEAHRDAMLGAKHAGARSSSGEGGQNPYYYKSGIASDSQQAASGMFGVDAFYLNRGNIEINIKMAQGGKPGEGGQLMAVKVNEFIAEARGSKVNTTLISPQPLHDKYSIEDLARSIREYKQINPGAKVTVKLVASPNVGTIAAGVAKCGADIIEIAGFDGGTGASPLSSMQHAGLPVEIGVAEVNRVLIAEKLRDKVIVRASGGIRSAKDIVKLAILGADEFDFGRLALIAEGCFMQRSCENNNCGAGIATQDPAKIAKFHKVSGEDPKVVVTKAEESNTAMDVSHLIQIVSEDTRILLSELGEKNLKDIRGRRDLLEVDTTYADYLDSRGVSLEGFLGEAVAVPDYIPPVPNQFNQFNQAIISQTEPYIDQLMTDPNFNAPPIKMQIANGDKAAFTALAGVLARDVHERFSAHVQATPREERTDFTPQYFRNFIPKGNLNFDVTGSAGQGFAMGICDGINVVLHGEANDAVCQNMCGGSVVMKTREGVQFKPEITPIGGQSCMYGARGGQLFAHGTFGDRFAVRNSGGEAVIEGCGEHGCEYMIKGAVVVLGKVGENFGAAMSGGIAYLYPSNDHNVNKETIGSKAIEGADLEKLTELLTTHYVSTQSQKAFEELEYIRTHGCSRMFAYVSKTELNELALAA